jgi:hypothetical protein
LLVRHCQDAACRTSNTTEIDAAPQSDTYAIGTDANGFGVVAYVRTILSDELIVAHCVDQACSSVTKTIVDESPFIIRGVAIRTTGDNRTLVVYNSGQLLKAAHCIPVGDNPCLSTMTSVLDEFAGFYVSLAIGSDGKGLIGYLDQTLNNRLRIAHCVDTACTSVTKGAVADAQPGRNFAVSTTAETPSLGVIAFRDSSARLASVHCADPECSTFSP